MTGTTGDGPTMTDTGRLATGDGRPDGIGGLLDSLIDKLVPTVHAQTGGGDSGDSLRRTLERASQPRRLAAEPRNGLKPDRLGAPGGPATSSSQSLLLVCPGRGLPLGLSMNYNSRIWSRHGNAVTFVDSWPY